MLGYSFQNGAVAALGGAMMYHLGFGLVLVEAQVGRIIAMLFKNVSIEVLEVTWMDCVRNFLGCIFIGLIELVLGGFLRLASVGGVLGYIAVVLASHWASERVLRSRF